MLAWIEKTNAALDRWLIIITGSALIFATILCFGGVILRYVFGISFEWNEELCRYSMIIMVYFWGEAMIRNKQHIYLSLWADRLKGRAQDWHRFTTSLLTAALTFPLAIWGFQLVADAYAAELRTMSLIFPLWPAYAIIPTGLSLIFLQAFLDILRLSSSLTGSKPKTSG